MTSTTDESLFMVANVFGKGEPNTAFAQYFTGKSFLKNLVADPECAVGVHNVTFEPGCRNNWHIHHATSGGGQVLICTAGSGWYQEEGKDAISLNPGDVVFTRAGVKQPIPGSLTSRSRFRAITRPTNGSNRLTTPVTRLRDLRESSTRQTFSDEMTAPPSISFDNVCFVGARAVGCVCRGRHASGRRLRGPLSVLSAGEDLAVDDDEPAVVRLGPLVPRAGHLLQLGRGGQSQLDRLRAE